MKKKDKEFSEVWNLFLKLQGAEMDRRIIRLRCSEGYLAPGQEEPKHWLTKRIRVQIRKRKWARAEKEREIRRQMRRDGLRWDNGQYLEERRLK